MAASSTTAPAEESDWQPQEGWILKEAVDFHHQGDTLFVYVAPPERMNCHAHNKPWMMLGLGMSLILYVVLVCVLWLLDNTTIAAARVSETGLTGPTSFLLCLDALRRTIVDVIPSWIGCFLWLHITLSLAYVGYLQLIR